MNDAPELIPLFFLNMLAKALNYHSSKLLLFRSKMFPNKIISLNYYLDELVACY